MTTPIRSALLLLAVGTAAAQQPPFPAALVPAGLAPQATEAADLDLDGITDLVTVNQQGDALNFGGSVSVNRGRPGAGFAPTQSYPIAVSTYPTDLALGDLNGDGVPDVVVTAYLPSEIRSALGDGAAGFGVEVVDFVGVGPQGVDLADLNDDGILDVATAQWDGTGVSMRLGDGVGGFSILTNIFLPGAAADIVLGDANGDGETDALVPLPLANQVVLLAGSGLGELEEPVAVAAANSPESVAVDDLNGDGLPDLVVAASGDDALVVRTGLGEGAFGTAATVAVPDDPVSVTTAEIEGTPGRDLVACCRASGQIAFVASDGQMGFTLLATAPAGEAPIDVVAADLDGDGLEDPIATSVGSQGVALALSTQPGGPVVVPTGAGAQLGGFVLADLNHDGARDLALCDGQAVRVALADGSGGFLPLVAFPAGPAPSDLVVGLIDGDAHPDIAATGPASVSVIFGDGHGSFGAPVSYATQDAPGSPSLGDVDQDLDLDLLLQANVAPDKGNLNLLLNHGDGSFAPFLLFTSVMQGHLDVADLTGDGYLDVLVTSEAASALAVLAGDGWGGFGTPQILFVADPLGSDAGDLDGDGDVDIAVALGAAGEVAVFRNQGDGSMLQESVPTSAKEPADVLIRDVDADGIADLVTADGTSGTVTVLHGLLPASFGSMMSFDAAVGASVVPIALVAGDADADGDFELLVRHESSAVLTLLHGTLEPPFVDLGDAKPGVAGLPQLGGTGTLVPGSPTELLLSHAAPNAPLALFVSTSSTPVPCLGGILHAAPVGLTVFAVTDGAGQMSASFPWPGVPAGVVLFLQAVNADPAAGAALSNALELVP